MTQPKTIKLYSSNVFTLNIIRVKERRRRQRESENEGKSVCDLRDKPIGIIRESKE